MSLHEGMTRNGLVRPIDDRVLGGVCAGLGRRFGLEPWPARLLFVLVLMLLPGSQLLVYPILWILMPSEYRCRSSTRTRRRPTHSPSRPTRPRHTRSRRRRSAGAAGQAYRPDRWARALAY